jgi:hypothetical protein
MAELVQSLIAHIFMAVLGITTMTRSDGARIEVAGTKPGARYPSFVVEALAGPPRSLSLAKNNRKHADSAPSKLLHLLTADSEMRLSMRLKKYP